MGNLESTRMGWVFRWLGVFFIMLAVGLAVTDVIFHVYYVLPVNLITLGSGLWCFHMGTKGVRQAREYHAFMEDRLDTENGTIIYVECDGCGASIVTARAEQ